MSVTGLILTVLSAHTHVSRKPQVSKTVPASYTLPLQSVPGPLREQEKIESSAVLTHAWVENSRLSIDCNWHAWQLGANPFLINNEFTATVPWTP